MVGIRPLPILRLFDVAVTQLVISEAWAPATQGAGKIGCCGLVGVLSPFSLAVSPRRSVSVECHQWQRPQRSVCNGPTPQVHQPLGWLN